MYQTDIIISNAKAVAASIAKPFATLVTDRAIKTVTFLKWLSSCHFNWRSSWHIKMAIRLSLQLPFPLPKQLPLKLAIQIAKRMAPAKSECSNHAEFFNYQFSFHTLLICDYSATIQKTVSGIKSLSNFNCNRQSHDQSSCHFN